MKPTESTSATTSRRRQRSLPRTRNFFDTLLINKRRRVRAVLALALACAGATAYLTA
jgi:hypothetical protein